MKGTGLVARLNRDIFFDNLRYGSPDATVSKFVTPKLTRDAAEGFVIQLEPLPLPRVKAGEPLSDSDLSMGRLLAGMTRLEIDHLVELPQAIVCLKEKGRLPPKNVILHAGKSPGRPIAYVPLLDRTMNEAPEKLPEGIPFPKTMQTLFEGLRKYGRLLLTVSDETDLRDITRMVG